MVSTTIPRDGKGRRSLHYMEYVLSLASAKIGARACAARLTTPLVRLCLSAVPLKISVPTGSWNTLHSDGRRGCSLPRALALLACGGKNASTNPNQLRCGVCRHRVSLSCAWIVACLAVTCAQCHAFTSSFDGASRLTQLVLAYRDRSITDDRFLDLLRDTAVAIQTANAAESGALARAALDLCATEFDRQTAYLVARALMRSDGHAADAFAALVRAELLEAIVRERANFFAAKDLQPSADRWKELLDTVKAAASVVGYTDEQDLLIDHTLLVILLRAQLDSCRDGDARFACYGFIAEASLFLPERSSLLRLLLNSGDDSLLSGRSIGGFTDVSERIIESNRKWVFLLWVQQYQNNYEQACRIQDNSKREAALRQVVEDAVQRLNATEVLLKQVREDQARLHQVQVAQAAQIEGLQAATNRLAIETRRELVVLPEVAHSGTDADQDGIDDGYESQLLVTFAPIFRLHDPSVHLPTPRVGVPMDASAFLAKANSTPPLTIDDLRQERDNWRWQPGWGAIASPDERRRYSGDPGFYGRVWKFFDGTVNGEPKTIYSVQYYLFISFNSRGANNHVEKAMGLVQGDIDRDSGSHDGDWICVDLGVDVSAPGAPYIHHAVLHNHGRQHFLYPQALEIIPRGSSRHPVVYLEDRCNEPWPNRGSRNEGWPTPGGFATTGRFIVHVGNVKVMDENEVCGEHWGYGIEYDPARNAERVRNLGERSKRGDVLVVDGSDDVRQLMTFEGGYGSFVFPGNVNVSVAGGVWDESLDLGKEMHGGTPMGPPFQPKMWHREFNRDGREYPFAAGSNPFNPVLSFVVTHTVEGGAALNTALFERDE